MVELADGRWFMVSLGVRGDESRGSNMGRETHLMPMIWEREPYEWKSVNIEWPVVAPKTGKVERYNALPFEQMPQVKKSPFTDNFNVPKLKLDWNFRRVPHPNVYSLADRPGYLRLFSSPDIPMERGRASLMGIRQTESDFEYRVAMEFNPSKSNVEAGINLFQKDDNYLSYTVARAKDNYELRLISVSANKPRDVLKRIELKGYNGNINLRLTAKEHDYQFSYSLGW